MNRTVAFVLVSLTASMLVSAHAQDKSDNVTLRVVKYDGLKDEVLKNRGKVVLIDFWGDFCPPCKSIWLPHTVELHDKFASKGLVVMTVAVDPIDDEAPSTKDNLLKFLKRKNAAFTNLWLDEPVANWQQKLRSEKVPFMYVFSRSGKWTLLKEEDLDSPKNLDRLVEELLAEK